MEDIRILIRKRPVLVVLSSRRIKPRLSNCQRRWTKNRRVSHCPLEAITMADPKNSAEEREKMDVTPVVDQAAAYLAQTSDYPPLSPSAEKKMVRKMDWILIPMVCCYVPFHVTHH